MRDVPTVVRKEKGTPLALSVSLSARTVFLCDSSSCKMVCSLRRVTTLSMRLAIYKADHRPHRPCCHLARFRRTAAPPLLRSWLRLRLWGTEGALMGGEGLTRQAGLMRADVRAGLPCQRPLHARGLFSEADTRGAGRSVERDDAVATRPRAQSHSPQPQPSECDAAAWDATCVSACEAA